MRVVLLTRNAPPFVRCAQAIADAYNLVAIATRSDMTQAPYETGHALDGQQTAFETEVWFGGTNATLGDFAPVTDVAVGGDNAEIKLLAEIAPDFAVGFGVSTFPQAALEMMGQRFLALGSGDPEHFRGCDVPLWTVFHGEYRRLCGVVQQAAAEPNGGAILQSEPAVLFHGMALPELRLTITESCITGLLKTLEFFDKGGMLSINQLQHLGRRYSPMPAVLKEYCAVKFARHTQALA